MSFDHGALFSALQDSLRSVGEPFERKRHGGAMAAFSDIKTFLLNQDTTEEELLDYVYDQSAMIAATYSPLFAWGYFVIAENVGRYFMQQEPKSDYMEETLQDAGKRFFDLGIRIMGKDKAIPM